MHNVMGNEGDQLGCGFIDCVN